MKNPLLNDESPIHMTTNQLDNLVVESVAPAKFQIADRIRQMIKNRELSPNVKLPSTRKLGEQLGVNPTAVHRALAQLVNEGLLFRSRNLGTFVAEPLGELKRLGFYYHTAKNNGEFSRALLAQLASIGREEGFTVEVFSDTRDKSIADTEPPAELRRLARTRWLQGWVADSAPNSTTWYDSLPIPRAVVSNPQKPNSISWNRRAVVSRAVNELAAKGCQKIGIIAPLILHNDPDADSYQAGFYKGLVTTLKELDLPFTPAWSYGLPAVQKYLPESEMPGFGYNAAMEVFSQKDKPDGLFIYPDTVATGALMALAKLDIKIPDQCQLLLHTNAETPIFCPYPVDRLIYRANDAAIAMVKHIRNILAGKASPQVELPYYIEKSLGI
jgi:DNA-binding transcriptional regulator YhcF (GntR family)